MFGLVFCFFSRPVSLTLNETPLSVFSPNSKRKYKDSKFGFGGRKKGSKWNTKESHNDVSGFRAKVAHGKAGKKFSKGGKKNVRRFFRYLCFGLKMQLFYV